MAAMASSLDGEKVERCHCGEGRVGKVDGALGIVRIPAMVLVGLVMVYRWFLSPLKIAIFGPGARCRFEPSCSAYAVEALRRHGFFYGVWLAGRRLSRCHPWGAWGPDPVPEKKSNTREACALHN
jgi:putative membrane protein insertion efficiency factor